MKNLIVQNANPNLNQSQNLVRKQNKTLQKLGTLHSLKIDTDSRKIELLIGLKGEPSPLQFEAFYDIVTEQNHTFAHFYKITSEKEWISEIINLWLENNGSPNPISLDLPFFTPNSIR